VYSILLHFDPNLSGIPFDLTQGIAQSGSITFDRPILGVYVTSGALNATDSIFSPGGVSYPTSPGRDLDFNYYGDQYSISPDRHELSLTMFCHNGDVFDEMRIILGNYVPDGDVNVGGFVDVKDTLLGIQAALGNRLLSTEEFGHGDVAPLVSNVPTPNGDLACPMCCLLCAR